jgi:Tfp pilus assembly protein PilN
LQEEVNRTCAASEIPISTIVAAGGIVLPFAARSVETSCLHALSDHPERLDIDLELQEDVLARIAKDKKARQRSAAMAGIVAAVVLGATIYNHTLQIQSVQQAADAWKTRNKAEISKETSLTDQVALLTSEDQALDQALKPAQTVGDALLAAANEAPSGVWLTSITGERGRPITLRGTATSSDRVTEYVRTLEADNRFRNVKLVVADQGAINQAPVEEFSLQAVANGNVPVVDTSTPGGTK